MLVTNPHWGPWLFWVFHPAREGIRTCLSIYLSIYQGLGRRPNYGASVRARSSFAGAVLYAGSSARGAPVFCLAAFINYGASVRARLSSAGAVLYARSSARGAPVFCLAAFINCGASVRARLSSAGAVLYARSSARGAPVFCRAACVGKAEGADTSALRARRLQSN